MIYRLAAMWAAMRSSLPEIVGTPRFRRELLGVALVLLALLSAYVIGRGGDEGRLVAWWGNRLDRSLGQAAFLVPVLIALAALRAFGGQSGRVLEARHYLGGFAFSVAVVGLLQLGARSVAEPAGGALGSAVATLAVRGLGPFGAGLALFAAGVLAIFLLAGSDFQTFSKDVLALLEAIWRVVTAVVAAIGTVEGKIRRFGASLGSHRDADSSNSRGNVAAPVPEVAQRIGKSEARPPSLRAQIPEDLGPPVINVPTRTEPSTPVPVSPRSPSPPNIQNAPARPLPLPDISLLSYYDDVAPDTASLHAKARLIEETLLSFKVEAKVREINPGPAVTQFALEPGNGVKVRRITELQSDLALALAAPSIRIEAPIPGFARVGLEIPNAQIATVGLRETLESPSFSKGKQKLPIPLGRDVNGRYVIGDLTRMPHLLIAGATGAGKSVCLNAIISTFLSTRSPDDLKLLMIDPKMVELTGYNGVPHLQAPVVTEMDKVVGALRLTLREMERRYTIFSKLGVRNLDGYRMKIADEAGAEQLPYLVVIIDELADLMMTAPDEVETLLVRLAQMARATGIHLIIATQRPSVDVLTGLIKANIPSRIAFAVSSLTDSRVILDMPGAERLLGSGDMLFLPPDAAKPQRIQGAFIEDRDVHLIVQHWYRVAPVPRYAAEWLDLPAAGGNGDDDLDAEDDPLFEQALSIVRQQGTASASMLQRRLRVGYNRAARLIERMEGEGIIGPADGIRGRPVLVTEE
ncbi:MAG TPA: DNA translocase FtsK 4TM domain-containing protein [Thermomicrobiales bacterium]|nr:DNA translocase FtsK 4TM domain-containing protein [Thermomicrobiales bacterium]